MGTSDNLLLDVRGLVKSFKGRRVVDGVHFTVQPGEVVGLLGPNGAGKTTSFRMTVGLVQPDAGEVWLNGKECGSLPMYQRARQGMGYLPQEPSIFRRMKVRDNVIAVLEAMPLSRRDRGPRADELLDSLALSHLGNSLAETLSGGERRRLEIARALASEPSILMLDEPFAGVDPLAVDEIQGILHELRQDGIGILITDHSVRETLEICDRAYVIHRGQILREGEPDALINDPKVREVYLGDRFDESAQLEPSGATGVTAAEESGLAGD
jgi:lipopolysaccharide export system ATP-binding protein